MNKKIVLFILLIAAFFASCSDLEDIIDVMKTHELFSDNVKRKDDEATIQKTLFLRLEKGKGLQKILTENNIANKTKIFIISPHKRLKSNLL